jgi:hypothetical protein
MSNAVAMLGFMTTPMTLSGLQHLWPNASP